MTKLTQAFVSAMPTAAELLTPSMVGRTITGIDTKIVKTKIEPIRDLHILVCKLDNGTLVEINANSFNSLYFIDDAKDLYSMEDSSIKALNNKLDSVHKLIDNNPAWEGARRGLSAFEIADDKSIDFNSYVITAKRLRTRNGEPVLRPKAFSAYEEERALAEEEKRSLNMTKIYSSTPLKTLPAGESFKDLITYEYLLVPVK